MLGHRRKQVRCGLLRRTRFLGDVGTAQHHAGVEESFAVQCLGHAVAHLLQLRFVLFGERGVLLPPNDQAPVHGIDMAKRNDQQGFRPGGDHPQADGAPTVRILGRRSQGCGTLRRERAENGLDISRCESARRMLNKRAIFLVEDGRHCGIRADIVQRGIQRPLKQRFRGRFGLSRCGSHTFNFEPRHCSGNVHE